MQASMAHFESTLGELTTIDTAWRALFKRGEESGFCTHPLYRAMWQDLAEAWCLQFPRRRKAVAQETTKAWNRMRQESAAGNFPALDRIHAEYEQMATRIFMALRADQNRLGASLCEQADGLDVPRGDDWQTIGIVSESTYRSQGYGASKYARESAEEYAQKARHYGLTATVEREEEFRFTQRHWRTGASMGESVVYRYVARAQTTALGAEILRYKSDVPLRERVRSCWARGINPRVDMPFLAPDYEERAGLNYFGGEVAQASA